MGQCQFRATEDEVLHVVTSVSMEMRSHTEFLTMSHVSK